MNLASLDKKDGRAIDLDILREFVGDDIEVIRHFLVRFFEALRIGMEKMRSMIILKQWRDISALAHTLKTSALAIGAFKFATMCGSMEKIALIQNDVKDDPENDPRQILMKEMNRTFIEIEEAVNAVLPLVTP